MKIEISKNESVAIKGDQIPRGRIAKVVGSDLYIFRTRSSTSTGEVIRVWVAGNDFESIRLDAISTWEVELLPEGTTVTFTF